MHSRKKKSRAMNLEAYHSASGDRPFHYDSARISGPSSALLARNEKQTAEFAVATAPSDSCRADSILMTPKTFHAHDLVAPSALRKSIPLPSQIESPRPEKEIRIHPRLAYDPCVSCFRFDMSSPPIEPYPGFFQEVATYPSLPSFSIVVPHFPWVLVVQRTTRTYVTVEDVLNALWHMLQIPFDDLKRRQDYTMSRRIDLFRGKHFFGGLSAMSPGEEQFLLHVC